MKRFFTSLLLILATTACYSQNAVNLMPYPKGVSAGNGKIRIIGGFSISLKGDPKDKPIEEASNRFLARLNARTLAYFKQQRIVLNQKVDTATLTILVKEKKEPVIGVDESYQISIDNEKASLVAETTIGAMRGLETLLQLVSTDKDGYYLPEIKIDDSPRFKWRGMMVDVSRHFLPIGILRRNIDAMAMVKLNVLHLHLSDDEGFRVESKVFPRLQEFGSNGQYYSQNELKDLVKYACARGIIIIPEFDLPGHSTSWFAGYPELASKPGIYKPDHRFSIKPGTPMGDAVKIILQSPTPTLDPTKESVYQFLDKFVAEMTTIFPAPYLHIGADENNGLAWKENARIVHFMNQKGMKDVQDLQAYFVNRMHAILKRHGRGTIAWEESYNAVLPKDVVLQVWGAMGQKRATPSEIAGNGNAVLISKGFYLDYFYPASFHYQNPNIPTDSNPNILGGEAALWAELVDENSFEGRAWPRTAAVAERLWSPENVKDVDDMYRRLFVLSDRLEDSGLNHRLNASRMLSALCNGQDVKNPLIVLQTLAPARGVGRLMSQFLAPEQTKYQSVPLVDLPDLANTDSKQAWQFNKAVNTYLSKKDTSIKNQIIGQLNEWKSAALQIPIMTKTAPNLTEFAAYAAKVVQVTNIGLEVLEKSPDQKSKADMLQTLKGMKGRADRLEILILPDIEGLVTGS